jgi:integrase
MLWDRTIDAIKKYQKSSPNASEHLFVTDFGTPINSQRIQKYWMKIRDKFLKEKILTTTIYFEEIRDGAQTAAIHGGATQDQTKFLMGHKVPGITDAYLKRNPTLATQASRSIELYYFGTSSVGETSE